ncbi:hypothetical protein [Roseateles chitosanitabidus]|uniref:hypothetical protein n=1 Tax=Roseateles chitosanitabidus TaxID=65048 RepID=UPI00082E8A28|nr:hypothetical protein [Roseateles chitosanitabidus]
MSDANSTAAPRIGVLARLGLDFHILATLLFRGWSILAGGATALLIPTFLSPSQQGYYYTFNAVLATQIFFELGLNHVLTQLTSHAAAHLRRVSDTHLDGDIRWQRAVVSLLSLSTKWNAVMASLFFIALLAGGSLFFSHKGSLPTSQWLTTWVVLIAATALNLAMSARLAICEGLGEVGQVARLRLRQSVAGYAMLWLLLLSGQGLWAAAAVPLVSAAGTAWWLSRQPLLRGLRERVSTPADDRPAGGYTYGRDVFPLQWRIALSWASGYFIFNFLTPVVFAHQGEVAAGRLGLGLTIFSAISTVGISWISAKIPTFSAHIARRERAELNALFDRQALRSVGATTFCVVLFVGLAQVAGHFVPKILDRLPPLPALLLLAAVTVVNSIVFAMAAYMRAHKEEPLLAQSVAAAVLIGGGVYWMAHVSLTATVAAYAAVSLFVALPWCALIFSRYRQRTE